MNFLRVLLCVVMPPLAVIGKGGKGLVLTTILTLLGWIPGVLCALVLTSEV